MSEDIMLMEMPGAFEWGQHRLTRPDVVRVDNAQNNGRPRRSMPLGVILTGYRLLTTIMIVGIGIPKAVYSYYGQSLISPSLDWVGGIIFTLLLFWLGVIEATRPELSPNFFQIDLAPAILRFMGCDEIPSPLDPPTLESLHRDGDNVVPLGPPTLGSASVHRGDTYPPLAPEVLSDDTFPPLIPEVSGVLRRGGTSPPLAPGILRASRHGDTSPPLAPEILGGLSDDTSPPLIPEVPGVLGRDDTPPTLAPEILRPLPRRRGVTPYPPPFQTYISRHPHPPHPPPPPPPSPPTTYPPPFLTHISRHPHPSPPPPPPPPSPPTRSFPAPPIPANSHPSVPAPPMPPTVQRAGTEYQNVAPAMPGFRPLPPSSMQGGQRPFTFTPYSSYRDAYERESEVDLTDLRIEEFQSSSIQSSSSGSGPYSASMRRRKRPSASAPQPAQAGASRAIPYPPDLSCRLCRRMSPRQTLERFGGFCSEMHKWQWESYGPGAQRPY